MKATTRYACAVFLAVLALGLLQVTPPTPAYGQATDRAKRLGAKLLCMCGCNQILTACNHVGCTTSAKMLKQLDQLAARNDPDDLILQAFVQEYGPKVLAEPPSKGFSAVAWWIPGVTFAIGLGLVVLVIRQWRRRTALATPSPAAPGVSPELLARARQQADEETED